MTGKNNNSMGRLAALAAVDRIRRLLEITEGDPQVQEILMASDPDKVQQSSEQAKSQTISSRARCWATKKVTKHSPLGPSYFAAKRRYYELLRTEQSRRMRPIKEN